MYLTRIEIDREDRRKTRDLLGLETYHSRVEDAFPEEREKKERSRKLWRIDRLGGKDYLLLLSQDLPSEACLERYGKEGSYQVKNYDPYLEKLKEGMTGNFRLVANPSIALKDPKGGVSKKTQILPVAAQVEYLEKRAGDHGFSLRDLEIVERGYESLRKNGRKTRLIRVAYEGSLKIENLDLFKETLCQGLGRYKAYGFGLLTFIPIS